MATKCKAKNPYSCRFHSKDRYKRILEELKYNTDKIDDSTTIEAYTYNKNRIAKLNVQADSNEFGFRKLIREFKQAGKSNNLQLQAELANRIKVATEERTKDGIAGPWDGSFNNSTSLGDKIIEMTQALKPREDKVYIPIQLSGTFNILNVYSRLLNKGYEVTNVEAYKATGQSHDDVSAEVLAKLKEPENESFLKENFQEPIWKNVLNKEDNGSADIFMRGLSFKFGKRIITVESKDLSDELF